MPLAEGTLAALGQALIPYLTGKIIDFASIDPDRQQFIMTTLKLVGVSLACAVATGVRGGLFTVAMTRLNVRIRTHLFTSLLQQETGFYDTSKTGILTYTTSCANNAQYQVRNTQNLASCLALPSHSDALCVMLQVKSRVGCQQTLRQSRTRFA